MTLEEAIGYVASDELIEVSSYQALKLIELTDQKAQICIETALLSLNAFLVT